MRPHGEVGGCPPLRVVVSHDTPTRSTRIPTPGRSARRYGAAVDGQAIVEPACRRPDLRTS
jgi:hypothetical protein